MNNEMLELKYDMLVDEFDESDDIAVEDVNETMRAYWSKFLNAGFDPTQDRKSVV